MAPATYAIALLFASQFAFASEPLLVIVGDAPSDTLVSKLEARALTLADGRLDQLRLGESVGSRSKKLALETTKECDAKSSKCAALAWTWARYLEHFRFTEENSAQRKQAYTYVWQQSTQEEEKVIAKAQLHGNLDAIAGDHAVVVTLPEDTKVTLNNEAVTGAVSLAAGSLHRFVLKDSNGFVTVKDYRATVSQKLPLPSASGFEVSLQKARAKKLSLTPDVLQEIMRHSGAEKVLLKQPDNTWEAWQIHPSAGFSYAKLIRRTPVENLTSIKALLFPKVETPAIDVSTKTEKRSAAWDYVALGGIAVVVTAYFLLSDTTPDRQNIKITYQNR